MHAPLPPAIPELPIWLEEKAPIVFPTLLAINGLKLAVIFGKTEYLGKFPNNQWLDFLRYLWSYIKNRRR